jgi:hypothetical protein
MEATAAGKLRIFTRIIITPPIRYRRAINGTTFSVNPAIRSMPHRKMNAATIATRIPTIYFGAPNAV